jgi:hypothetical protein
MALVGLDTLKGKELEKWDYDDSLGTVKEYQIQEKDMEMAAKAGVPASRCPDPEFRKQYQAYLDKRNEPK